MARTRLHDLDDLLDVAEQIVTEADPTGLTLRSLAARTGASNGTIYHAFRSKEELLARLWLRASARLESIMSGVIGTLESEKTSAVDAVVGVALAPVTLVRQHRGSARLFFGQRADQLFSSDLADDVVTDIRAMQARFADILNRLAAAMWGRTDGHAIGAIAACTVDIPGGLLRRPLLEGRRVGTTIERRIEASVRAILTLPLPSPLTALSTSNSKDN